MPDYSPEIAQINRRFFDVIGGPNPEVDKRQMVYAYMTGIDTMFKPEDSITLKDREENIKKANEARKALYGENADTYLSKDIVHTIVERLNIKEGECGLLLNTYKDALQVKLGLVTETGERRENLIKRGEEAAEKLFLVKNPIFTFI